MDRITFVQSIVRTDRSMVEDVIDYFDHEMLLYELIGSSNKLVSVTDCAAKNISFQIDGNKQEIENLSLYLSTINKVVEYDKPLEVQCEVISDRSLKIKINSL